METGQYFGTFQNGIEDKKSGTEGVYIYIYMTLHGFKFKTTNPSYPPVHLEPKLLNKFSCDFKVPTFFFFLKKTVKKKR